MLNNHFSCTDRRSREIITIKLRMLRNKDHFKDGGMSRILCRLDGSTRVGSQSSAQ